MKLMLVIVQDEDAASAMKAMVKGGFRVTRLASTGGLLGEGNTTIVCGLEESQIDEAVKILESVCQSRQVELHRGHHLFGTIQTVRIGGAVGFVVDVDRFFKL